MGLFDKVMGPKEDKAKLSKEEAFAAVGFAAIAADGVITEEEARGFIVGLSRMKIFANFSDKDMNAMLNKLVNTIKKNGLDGLVKMANESLPEDMKQTAFAVATDLAFADGDVDQTERDILTKVQQLMGIPEAQAMKIIEVIMIKNKG
ncbi:MAG TPA: tellurite resistance TerB family protein [Methanomassiliicoccales archaeon]|jgi:tellurite resistance protein